MHTFHTNQSYRNPRHKFIQASHDQYNIDHTIVRGRVRLSGQFQWSQYNITWDHYFFNSARMVSWLAITDVRKLLIFLVSFIIWCSCVWVSVWVRHRKQRGLTTTGGYGMLSTFRYFDSTIFDMSYSIVVIIDSIGRKLWIRILRMMYYTPLNYSSWLKNTAIRSNTLDSTPLQFTALRSSMFCSNRPLS